MLTLLFIIGSFIVFGKMIGLAFKGAWGLTKIFFSLIFLPFVLTGMVLKGLFVIALPLLLICGIIAMIEST